MTSCWHDDVDERTSKSTWDVIVPDLTSFLKITGYINDDEMMDSSSGLTPILTKEETTQLYYLLAGRYAKSTVKYSDEKLFYGNICTIIITYGHEWKKSKEILKKLSALTDDQIKVGDTRINNNAENPSLSPSTATLEELTYIDGQNVTKEKLSDINALGLYREMIKEDKDEWFLNKFKVLFIKYPFIDEDGRYGG